MSSYQSHGLERLNASLYGELPRDNPLRVASIDTISAFHLPNPRMNCIQFARTNFVLACIHNARSMGFLVDPNNIGTMITQCLASSPFYRPVKPCDDPKEFRATVTKPSTPNHLRPTLSQVLYPHLAFMDFIPIPTLRTRAITLAAIRPQCFDMWKLKKDMALEEGLVHWSSTGSRRMGEGQGVPWDMRSWEAAPWFLRKWRLLLDGKDGEMWKQSLWWQRVRGEGDDKISSAIAA